MMHIFHDWFDVEYKSHSEEVESKPATEFAPRLARFASVTTMRCRVCGKEKVDRYKSSWWFKAPKQ